MSYEIHMLVQQAQIKPYDFMETLESMGKFQILDFLTKSSNNNKLNANNKILCSILII